MKKIFLLFLVAGIFTSCGGPTKIKSRGLAGSDLPMYWDTRDFPHKLAISDHGFLDKDLTTTTEEERIIKEAGIVWNQGEKIIEHYGATNEDEPFLSFDDAVPSFYSDNLGDYRSSNGGTMGVYPIENWPSCSKKQSKDCLPSSALAVTQLYGLVNKTKDKIKLTHADIFINKDNHCFYLKGDTEGAKGCYDLQSVAMHEYGHFLGLQHSDHGDSVMQPTIKKDQSYQKPHESDYTALEIKYPSFFNNHGGGHNNGMPQVNPGDHFEAGDEKVRIRMYQLPDGSSGINYKYLD